MKIEQPVTAMPWPAGWCFDLNDGGAPADPGPVSQAPAASSDDSIDTVDDALAELDRRDAERRAAKKAAKTADANKAEGESADEDDTPEPKKAKAEPDKKPAPKDDGDEDEDGDEDAEDEDSDDDERKEATDDEQEDTEELVTVELDGKKLEIPKGTPKALIDTVTRMASDLKADHTRKTTEAAQHRAQAAQQEQAATTLLRQVQAAQQAVVSMAQQMIGEPPGLELAQSDIQSYTIQKALYEQRVGQLQHLMGHGKQLTEHQRQQQAQQQQQALQGELQQLVKVLPSMADQHARRAFMNQAAQTAAASGFTLEDVAGVGDHRMLHLLHRLVTLERAAAARAAAAGSVKTKLANVPPKVNKAGAVSNEGTGLKRSKAKQQFLKSGRTIKDAMRALAEADHH